MTKSKEVRPLQVGERVRVYDTYVQVGEIDAINTSGNIRIKSGSAWYHPKQCRRLKPRPKPQERVRAERWVVTRTDGLRIGYPSKSQADGDTLGMACRHFVELRPAEVVVSRDDLAKAWDEMQLSLGVVDPHHQSSLFNYLCRVLELGAK